MIVTLVDSGLPDSTSSEAVRSTKRRGTDLIYSCSVSLQQALKSEPVAIPTLDGRILKVSVDQLITPKSVIKIEGEGMPILEQSNNVLTVCLTTPWTLRGEVICTSVLRSSSPRNCLRPRESDLTQYYLQSE